MYSQTPLVSIIIPNWNKPELTIAAIRSVYDSKGTLPVEVIVVDNGSTDGSAAKIGKVYPQVKILANVTNRGFAGGNNDGLRIASGLYILLLNNDAELRDGCIKAMVDYLDGNSDVAVVGGKVTFAQAPDRLDSALTYLLPFGYCSYRGHGERDAEAFSIRQDVFCVKGACMMIKKSAVDAAGLFYDDFFMYFEETDLSWRLWTKGLRTVYLPEAKAQHLVGKSVHELPSAFIDYHSFKNRLASTLMNFEARSLMFAIPVQIGLIFAGAAIYAVTGRSGNAQGLLKALLWNVSNLRQTLFRRHQIQRTRVLSDAEILRRVGSRFQIARFVRFAMVYIGRW